MAAVSGSEPAANVRPLSRFPVRQVYTALFHLALPFVLLRLYWKGRTVPGYRQRWRERLGFYDDPPAVGVIWFHAVSVGEAEAAFPLINSLRSRYPAARFLVTCTTPTGSARIHSVLGNGFNHVYLPYDIPFAANRFLDHFRPCLAVIMETEIWPNLFLACAQRGIPLAIVNGRLSEKSYRGYLKIRGLVGECLQSLKLLHAQSQGDAHRYIALGADSAIVDVSGNVKFDIDYSDELRRRAEEFRNSLFGTRPVWIAGSTHAREEELILQAHAEIRQNIPDALLILAPRHPERNSDVAELCGRAGQKVSFRSETRKSAELGNVLLLDTLGELRWIYGAADVAFVGGSLITRGGHNVLEPAAAGIPVIFGPYMFNFADIAAGLVGCGGGFIVSNPGELTSKVIQFILSPDLRQSAREAGRAFLAANRGAVARTTDALQNLLQQSH